MPAGYLSADCSNTKLLVFRSNGVTNTNINIDTNITVMAEGDNNNENDDKKLQFYNYKPINRYNLNFGVNLNFFLYTACPLSND